MEHMPSKMLLEAWDHLCSNLERRDLWFTRSMLGRELRYGDLALHPQSVTVTEDGTVTMVLKTVHQDPHFVDGSVDEAPEELEKGRGQLPTVQVDALGRNRDWAD